MSERFYPNGSSVYVEADGVGVRFCAAYSDADAQRIAAALNHEAQLVEALRRVPDMPEMHVTKRTDYTEGYVEGWNSCRAALAAAGVGYD